MAGWVGRAGYTTAPNNATVKKIRQSISNYRKKLLISKVDGELPLTSEPAEPTTKNIPTRSAPFQRKQKQTRAGRFNTNAANADVPEIT